MPVKPIGSDWDVNGCITSAGYVWCEILGKCLRTWEQACQYPTNCLTWNDGCNTCMLVEGEIGGCTEMYCFQQGNPYCMVQTPDQEVGIEPWLIDPPVVNPFLGDGH
ncbi:MAG TPA: hypothetical protein DCX27_21190 [Balneola sp.]|nr:hypothetical protein [Balneola sp.]|tara:strand:+ start:1194 stop:1514 length:321 start_codon:yes stop_codon:yes gene_type:complete